MTNDARPIVAAGIEVHAVEDGCVVYVPADRKVHFLNETAMLVLEQCTGATPWSDMQAAFEREWGPGSAFDIRDEVLPAFEAAGIIVAAPDVGR